jgi:hypothetical protein
VAFETSLSHSSGFESFISTRPAVRTTRSMLRRALNGIFGAIMSSSLKGSGKEILTDTVQSEPEPNHIPPGNASVLFPGETTKQRGWIELCCYLITLPEPPLLFRIRMVGNTMLVSIPFLLLIVYFFIICYDAVVFREVPTGPVARFLRSVANVIRRRFVDVI